VIYGKNLGCQIHTTYLVVGFVTFRNLSIVSNNISVVFNVCKKKFKIIVYASH
jgi:hypothetical protein